MDPAPKPTGVEILGLKDGIALVAALGVVASIVATLILKDIWPVNGPGLACMVVYTGRIAFLNRSRLMPGNRSDDEQQRFFRRLGPSDFERDSAGESFWVGDYEYVVEVGPPLIPAILLRLSDNGTSMPFNLVFLYPAVWLAWRIEPRARVAVSRRTGRRYFRMVHVEYLPDVEAAERRQLEIRKSWTYGEYESSPVLDVLDVIGAYRSARGRIPRVKS